MRRIKIILAVVAAVATMMALAAPVMAQTFVGGTGGTFGDGDFAILVVTAASSSLAPVILMILVILMTSPMAAGAPSSVFALVLIASALARAAEKRLKAAA